MGALNDGRSKKRGRNYYKRVTLVKPEHTILPCCIECGQWPAVKRWYSKMQPLCAECARPKFDSFLKSLIVCGIGILLISIIVIAGFGKQSDSKNQNIKYSKIINN